MTTALSAAPATPADTPTLPRREVAGAWLMLLGLANLHFGLAWDLQWHWDVGPDWFFTAPHMLMYSGSALTGLTCLAVVLASTWDARRGAPAFHGPTVTVLGAFRVPLAFLVGGLGAAGHLLYGATDVWWHTIYGFDVSGTPSHVGLFLATEVQIVAVVMAFAPLCASRSGRWGLAAACALGALATEMSSAVAMAALCILALGTVAGVTRSGRWALATGLLFLAVYAVTYAFTPLAARAYADVLGLPFRDYATGLPRMDSVWPSVAAILAVPAGAVWLTRRRPARPLGVVAALGALAGAGSAILYALTEPGSSLPATAATATAAGATAGWLGWHCAALLRRSCPTAVAR